MVIELSSFFYLKTHQSPDVFNDGDEGNKSKDDDDERDDEDDGDKMTTKTMPKMKKT